MELLILLPLLLGVLAYDSFFGDDSDDADTGQGTNQPASKDENLILGKSVRDEIDAGIGDDLVLAGSNADRVIGGEGSDVLLGENGADTIYGGAGIDLLAGGRGDDRLYGGDGVDLLIGGKDDDLLYGGAGNDALAATSGADTLYGDAGNDLMSGFDNPAGISRAQALASNLLVPEADALGLLDDFDTAARASFGAAYSSAIEGRVEAAFRDYDPNDVKDNVLYGGAGDDALRGDFSDTLTGGAGDDRFSIFWDGVGERVTITDFDPSEETLRIFMPANANSALTLVDGATPAVGVTVLVGGNVVAQLLGVTKAQVPTSVFEVVVG